jgi:hypothetical protein
MRILPQLLALMVLVTFTFDASAQLIGVTLKENVPAKEYKNYTVKYQGRWVLIGEPKSGIFWDQEKGQSGYVTDKPNQLFVFDSKQPGKAAYKLKGGEKVSAGKKHVVSIPGKHIDKLFMVDRIQTLPGLAEEYRAADDLLKKMRKKRKAHAKNTPEWYTAGHGLVTSLEAHENWLLNFGFASTAKKIRKEIEKERKLAAAGLRAKQAKADQDSVKVVDTHEALLRVSEESYDNKPLFHSASSNHFRIHYLVEGGGKLRQHMSDAQAKDALRFAERVLDGFRADYVDPYAGDDFEDTIPDGLLAEWFFGHNDLKRHDHFAGELFGTTIGTGIPDEQRAAGTAIRTGVPLRMKFLWRMIDTDFQGVIAHQIGHIMAEFHYGGNEGPIKMDWLAEALGDYISVKYRGHIAVTCFSIKPSTYLKTDVDKDSKRTEGFGRRSLFDFIAFSKAGPIRAVALKDLADMGDADLAKGASFFAYLVENEGRAGHRYLRAAAKFSRSRATLIDNWRKAASEIFGVEPREALSGIEGRWRDYVKEQMEKRK